MLMRLLPPKTDLRMGVLIELGAALLGAVILTMVLLLDPTAGYFPVCSLMAFLGALIAMMLYGAFGVTQFDLRLSFGATRRQLILRQIASTAVLSVVCMALVALIFFAELTLYPRLFPNRGFDTDVTVWLAFFADPLIIGGIVLGMTVVYGTLSFLYMGLVMRFGHVTNFFFLIFYLCASVGKSIAARVLRFLKPLLTPALWGVLGAAVLVAVLAYVLRVMCRREVRL